MNFSSHSKMKAELKILIRLNVLSILFSAKCALSVMSEQRNEIEISNKISEFRALIKPNIFPSHSFVHKFILDNDYIYQWLSEYNFDLDQATSHFREHLKWRNNENVDRIHLENWEYFKTDYPQFINISNKTNELIAEVWLSDWNVRKAVLSGRNRELLRWALHLVEISQRKFSEIRLKARKSNNTSFKAVEIVDVEGFNSWQHGCISCINTVETLGQIVENQYPGLWKNVYMINAGPIFRQILATMGRYFKTMASGTLRIYTRRHEWLPVFDKEISKEQRSTRFGGHLKRFSE